MSTAEQTTNTAAATPTMSLDEITKELNALKAAAAKTTTKTQKTVSVMKTTGSIAGILALGFLAFTEGKKILDARGDSVSEPAM